MLSIAEHTAEQRIILLLHWLYQQSNYPNVAFSIALLGGREILALGLDIFQVYDDIASQN
jgi:hypothetical protein